MKSESTIQRHLRAVLNRLGHDNCGPAERAVGEAVRSTLQWVIHKETYDPMSLLLDANIEDYDAGYHK